MAEERRVARCEECGETRAMATRTECFNCYRARNRASERQVDRHNPAIRREHRRLVSGWARLLGAMSELGISRPDALKIRDLAAPYVQPVREFLSAASEREQHDADVHETRDEIGLERQSVSGTPDIDRDE
jgi:hypothetical protein